MFGMKPPIRLAIGMALRDNGVATAENICETLRPQYHGERQLTEEAIEEHLQALKAVGIVRIVDDALGEHGNLIQTYALSDYGRMRVESFL